MVDKAKLIPTIRDVPQVSPLELTDFLGDVKDCLEVLLGRKEDQEQVIKVDGRSEIIDITTEYNMTTDDFGKTIRSLSENVTIIHLPAMDSSLDGSKVTIHKYGGGAVTVSCGNGYTIDQGSDAGTKSVTTTLVFEYLHSKTDFFTR